LELFVDQLNGRPQANTVNLATDSDENDHTIDSPQQE
jgi:hypothetical protein